MKASMELPWKVRVNVRVNVRVKVSFRVGLLPCKLLWKFVP